MYHSIFDILFIPSLLHVAPDDYIALSSEPVEFSPGTVLQCSPIVALSDDLDEPTEMFFVSLFQ